MATGIRSTSSSNPLRRWRKKNGVTQAQLAADLKVHPTIVSQWEAGRCAPSLPRFFALVRRTGLPSTLLLRYFVPNIPAFEGDRSDDVVVEFPGRNTRMVHPKRR